MNIWTLISHASLFAKIILVILIMASLFGWIIILFKSKQLAQATQQSKKFETLFWSGATLAEMYQQSCKQTNLFARLFRAGFGALRRPEHGEVAQHSLENVKWAMHAVSLRELEKLESGLSHLATIGSSSPYIGLVGTVWGIMNAFIGLAGAQQAALNQVAPGIAEALIATAIGLLAAIPAVIFYNLLSQKIEKLENRAQAFAAEILMVLDRSLH